LAHPGLYKDELLVEDMIRAGMDGIEAYHSDHTEADVRRYTELAQAWRLPVTAGSDYHGERGGVIFHAPLGSQKISVEVLDALRR
jgi:predicted metal-dependent phosphoesterase TrpH